MRTLEQWLGEYAVSHQNPFNQTIHKFAVPAITVSLLGLMWLIPFPWDLGAYFNWATIFVISCLIFYLTLDLKMTILMALFTGLSLVGIYFYQSTGYLLETSIAVFVIAWVMQFWGHKVEGKKPSFLQDIAFLLIGPLWTMKKWLG